MWSDALHSVGSWKDYLNTTNCDDADVEWYYDDCVDRNGYNHFYDESF